MRDLDALAALVDQAPPGDLPAIIGRLEAARARAWARLTAPQQESHDSLNGAALDIREVARRTGVSVTYLYRQARAGRLPFARRLGRRLRFDAAGLDRWLANRPRR